MALVEEAGAIVVRRVAADWQVLLVTAKRNAADWVFPKGHIEPGESAEQAALREAFEEGGVRGRVTGAVGQLRFTQGPDTMNVRYFLVVTDDRATPERGRTAEWHSYKDAQARLTFDDARRLLRDAWSLLPGP